MKSLRIVLRMCQHELQNLDEKCVNEILDTSEQLFLRIYDDFSGDKRRELYNLNFMKRIAALHRINALRLSITF